ncbi:MAG: cytochrome c biogenesis protein CcsA [Gemmatimonadales bacterium]
MPTTEGTARQARAGLIVTLIGLVLLAGLYVQALAFTPLERAQGAAQKIFYIHVPAAITAELAFILVGLASVFFLFLRDPRLDRFAESSAEVGVAFTVIVLTTGPLWGKPIWGAWWVWDARLTTTLFLFFLFIGYLLLRGAVPSPETRGRYAAVLGICGAVLVPFNHLTVYLFRTQHPDPIVLKPDAPSLPPEMLRTWLLGVAVFLLLYVGLLMQRYALGAMRQAAEDAHASR